MELMRCNDKVRECRASYAHCIERFSIALMVNLITLFGYRFVGILGNTPLRQFFLERL